MAQFWIPSARSAEVAWALRPLAGAAYQLLPAAPFLRPIAATAPPPGAAILLRVPADANAERWLLLVAPGADVRVNGLPTPPGPRVIEDHDELRVAAGPRLYFSTERPPQVVLWGMEPGQIDWGLELSPPVAGRLGALAAAVARELRAWGADLALLPGKQTSHPSGAFSPT